MAITDWKTVVKGHTAQGSEQLNIFYHQANDTDASVVTTLQRWVDDLAQLVLILQDTSSGIDGADLYKRDLGHWLLMGTSSVNLSGFVADNALPPQSAAVIRGITGVFKCRPTKFIGGLTQAALDGTGEVSSTTVAALADIMAFWITSYANGGGTIVPGTWQKKSSFFVPLTGGIVDNLFGSQRRRKQGVGA